MSEKLSVCIPVYNGAETILETIQSVLNQSFNDFELVIVDNASIDNTVGLISSINDARIKLYQNSENLGCGGNLNACMQKASGDILVYVCADDLMDMHALEKIYGTFQKSKDIGVVLRPYYWFDEDYIKPVRATKQFSEDVMVSIDGSVKLIRDALDLSGQLSGIGFRRDFINCSFVSNPFVETASVVLEVLKVSNAIILKDNIVAVRIGHSGSRIHSVYQNSPMLAWHNVIVAALKENRYKKLKKYLIEDFIATNYIGLVQIKNFGSFRYLMREIWYLLKFRWKNIFSVNFWFFAAGSIIVPSFLLQRLVSAYKNRINKVLLKNLSIKLNN
ncbi:MAG: glycosyltransferase family 2 protein [Parcubacteria group bacterium]|jgi:glycosyltransferase involved in cell wall biosynthesis